MKKRFILSATRVLLAVLLVVTVAGCLMAQPTFRRNEPSVVSVDAERLRAHVVMLSETFHPRDWLHESNLGSCADYIAGHFTNAGAIVQSQAVAAHGREYRNVVARFGVGRGSKLVIGAHYDSCGDTPGADDNASGVAALIELGYLLGRHPPDREIELVAYVLEEPPFFRTPLMGSAVHAASLSAEKDEIVGVIVLEMVGYFSDERGSQSYPSPLLKWIYPSRGNFIAVVGRWDQGWWVKRVKVGMKGTTDLPVYSIRAPVFVPGIDFSDHVNYRPLGIHALMVTDTAFYRNKAYHGPDDTADRLDYERMSSVVIAVFEATKSL
ncbi:MAG TPA: M28 family peptidase [Kiritimatiellia bacterium]|nr:M28 family peptidase [Kiritimatiellia bacterium]